MPHIHTQPGQCDYVANVYIVCRQRVLFRLHEKLGIWLPPGGHIELDEVPEEAAIREVKEEVGLDVAIWESGLQTAIDAHRGFRHLVTPAFMNIHDIGVDHRHICFIYFASSVSDRIIQPDTHEKTECRWLTWREIETDKALLPTEKMYALAALGTLADPIA